MLQVIKQRHYLLNKCDCHGFTSSQERGWFKSFKFYSNHLKCLSRFLIQTSLDFGFRPRFQVVLELLVTFNDLVALLDGWIVREKRVPLLAHKVQNNDQVKLKRWKNRSDELRLATKLRNEECIGSRQHKSIGFPRNDHCSTRVDARKS